MTASENLWIETPLIYSSRLSEITNALVYLKLENLQVAYSFKYRGISHFIKDLKQKAGPTVHLVIASSGNAALAAATVAKVLGLKCSVFLPEGAVESTITLLKRQNADVVLSGRFYAEALIAAKELVAKEPEAVMVPSYDSPLLWEGHSSLIHEIKESLGRKPDAIFCSVGGGGLLGGILVGCKAVGWDDVTIGTVETIGADCFYESMALNNGRFNGAVKQLPANVHLVHNEEHGVDLAHFESFSSKASSLCGSEPSAAVVRMALDMPGQVKPVSVPDKLSMQTLVSFADDHKFLVELACSTMLVPAYHPEVFDKVVPRREAGELPVVVFVVDGGFKIDLKEAEEYRKFAKEVPGSTWIVKCHDGQSLSINK